MEVQYLGHSAFRLKGKEGVVLTDPFSSSIGFSLGSVKADIITVSHQHDDHNFVANVKPVGNRSEPFIVAQAGEYEVGDVSIFGHPSFHDKSKGSDRGANIMFSIYVDDVHILHLGDLGHTLDEAVLENIPAVDVLLCPVGGVYTIDPTQAMEVINAIEPRYVIPMHYKTSKHDAETFGKLATLEEFCQVFGKSPSAVESLKVTTKSNAEGEETDTELVVLQPKTGGA